MHFEVFEVLDLPGVVVMGDLFDLNVIVDFDVETEQNLLVEGDVHDIDVVAG